MNVTEESVNFFLYSLEKNIFNIFPKTDEIHGKAWLEGNLGIYIKNINDCLTQQFYF